MERVPVSPRDRPGVAGDPGVGMFARIFREHFPLLPVEEEGRLHDPVLRENFIERLFVFRRWRDLLAAQPRRRDLVAFHTRHKLLILAHSSTSLPGVGAPGGPGPGDSGRPWNSMRLYQSRLMEGLAPENHPQENTNVLQHLMGYFKKRPDPRRKQGIAGSHRPLPRGHVPVVPTTLINHYVRKYHRPYLQEQFYLHPPPRGTATAEPRVSRWGRATEKELDKVFYDENLCYHVVDKTIWLRQQQG